MEKGRIVNPEELFYVQKRPPAFQVDCRGSIIAPGFIDVQINGEDSESALIFVFRVCRVIAPVL